MHIFTTGLKGFTGQHFAKLAHAAGHVVKGMQSDLTNAQALSQELADFVDALPQGQSWACVHLAAMSHVMTGQTEDYYRVNTLGTEYLLRAIVLAEKKHPARLQRILLASSANVYGNCPHSPISESQVPAPINHYSISKLAMEHIAKSYASQLPMVLVRPFNYTGTGQHESFLIPKLIGHFSEKQSSISLGNLDSLREFNAVGFVCNAYLHLLQTPQIELLSPNDDMLGRGIYNICTGNMHSLADLLELLKKITQHSIQIHQDPRLMRANELKQLGGDNAKLKAVWPEMPSPNLERLLREMLADANAHQSAV